jgi:hypothetical protein
MKSLSYWASRHLWLSRFLLILIYIFQGAIFVNIGFAILQDLPIEVYRILLILSTLIIVIISYVYDIKKSSIYTADGYYRFRNYCVAGIYGCLTILMMLWGNSIYRLPETVDNQLFSIQKSAIEKTNTPSVSGHFSNGYKIKKVSLAQRLLLKWKAKMMKRAAEGGYSKGGLIALFFLGLGVFSLAVPTTCGLLCANLGVLAVLSGLSGLAGIIIGVYFLVLGLKPPEEIAKRTENQHKKDRKLAILLIVLAALLVIGLIAVLATVN